MRSVVLLLGLLSFPSAYAQLQWETSRIHVTAEPGDESVDGVFRFTNTGSQPVTITNVSASCSCTVAALEKKTYAPGESGSIKATFALGGRSGPQSVSLSVSTDDDPPTPSVLTLTVSIPSLIELSALMLTWARDEEVVAKEVVVTAGTEVDIELKEARSSHPDFTITVTAEEPGRRYRVRIAPRSTAVPTTGTIRLHLEAIVGKPEIRQIFAIVR